MSSFVHTAVRVCPTAVKKSINNITNFNSDERKRVTAARLSIVTNLSFNTENVSPQHNIVATSAPTESSSAFLKAAQKAGTEYVMRLGASGPSAPVRNYAREGYVSLKSCAKTAHMVGIENATQKFIHTILSNQPAAAEKLQISLSLTDDEFKKSVEIFSCALAGVVGAFCDKGTVSKEALDALTNSQKNTYFAKLCARNFASITAFQLSPFEKKEDNDTFQRFLYAVSRLIDCNAQQLIKDASIKGDLALKLTDKVDIKMPGNIVKNTRIVVGSLIFFELQRTLYSLISDSVKKLD